MASSVRHREVRGRPATPHRADTRGRDDHPLTGAPNVAPLAMCSRSGRCPVTRTAICETGYPGYLAVKENGCSCIFAAGMTDVHTD